MPETRTAAVYARYSSDNQKATSIADQILSCRRFAATRDIVVLEDHIYSDHATSGARRDRIGLSALLASGTDGLFDLVLVDDLSRMARDLAFMLELVWSFRYNGIGVWSVADNINTLDDETILMLQVRGVFNEQMLRDLRKKTHRGQLGRKADDSFVGEATFGYRTIWLGAVRKDPHGRLAPERYGKSIDPVQADVVRRVFRDFADGHAITRIVKDLNAERVPGRYRTEKGWSPSTVSRMLGNTKYKGVWTWNKTRNMRDPRTGRRYFLDRPESEWVVVEDENLRIIDQPLWDAVQRRRVEVRRAWPGAPKQRGFSKAQQSRVQTFPPHLLSGAMVCDRCGGTVGLVSGKGHGYYGCLGAVKLACENAVKVPRRLAEDVILRSVQNRLLEPEPLQRMLRRVEEEAKSVYSEIPVALGAKRMELQAAKRRQVNLVEYVADGEGTKAVRAELAELEPRVEGLEKQLAGLQRASDKVIRAPSLGWLRKRLKKCRSLLELRTAKSAGFLRRLLCPIRLEPVTPTTGRPYYVAHTALDTLALLDDPESDDGSDSGAKSLRWWRRPGSNRGPYRPSDGRLRT